MSTHSDSIPGFFRRRQAEPAETPASAVRPSREEVEAAVRVLIAWTGDNPDRDGVKDTPARVVSAFEELYEGYRQDPAAVLERQFDEDGGYDDVVLVKDIPFYSHCEHHMMPFAGKVHIAYYPGEKVAGLSKLAIAARGSMGTTATRVLTMSRRVTWAAEAKAASSAAASP